MKYAFIPAVDTMMVKLGLISIVSLLLHPLETEYNIWRVFKNSWSQSATVVGDDMLGFDCIMYPIGSCVQHEFSMCDLIIRIYPKLCCDGEIAIERPAVRYGALSDINLKKIP